MGEFIGGIGAAFIIVAAAAVIVKLLFDMKIIKSKDSVIRYAKVSLVTILIGAVYLSAAALMYNEFHGRTNFFEFDKILGFVKTGFFSWGKHGFIAMYISFAASCVSSCMLYSVISKTASKENTDSIMLLLLSLPFAFMLFTPTAVPIGVFIIVIGIYLTAGKNTKSKLVRLIEDKLIKNAIIFRIVTAMMILFNGAALCVLIRGI